MCLQRNYVIASFILRKGAAYLGRHKNGQLVTQNIQKVVTIFAHFRCDSVHEQRLIGVAREIAHVSHQIRHARGTTQEKVGRQLNIGIENGYLSIVATCLRSLAARWHQVTAPALQQGDTFLIDGFRCAIVCTILIVKTSVRVADAVPDAVAAARL